MPKPLRAWLESLADEVEFVLQQHGIDAKIASGTVGPRLIRFGLVRVSGDPRLAMLQGRVRDWPLEPLDMSEIRAIRGDLVAVLGEEVTVVDGSFELKDGSEADGYMEFVNPNPSPIKLLKLLKEVQVDEDGVLNPLPPTTPLMGLTDAGRPLLFRLASEQVRHVLIAGLDDAGKSTLMRGIALSLVLTHEESDLKLIIADGQGSLACLGDAPHLTRPVMESKAELVEALQSLVRLRKRRTSHAPRVVVLLDDVDSWSVDRAVTEPLEDLLGCGHAVGIHVVLSTRSPFDWSNFDSLAKQFGVRIWGKGTSVRDLNLNGRGDFMVTGAGEPEPFRMQAAYVGPNEVGRALRQMETQPYLYRPQVQALPLQVVT